MSSLASYSFSSVLAALLLSELEGGAHQLVTIHAGHFALFGDRQGGVSDYLDESHDNEGPTREFKAICHVTWGAACSAAATIPRERRPRLMVLVNDWQFVSPRLESRRKEERAISRMRRLYYTETPTLPDYHLNEMKRHGLSTDLVIREREDRWLFSESALRSELHPLICEILANERRAVALGIREHFNEGGEPIVDVCEKEKGNVRLLYCGNTNCAGEVISLLKNLYGRGVRRFVNIYPSICSEPVNAGTTLAYRLFRLEGLMVTNIAVRSASNSRTDLHPVVERFNWDDFSLVTG